MGTPNAHHSADSALPFGRVDGIQHCRAAGRRTLVSRAFLQDDAEGEMPRRHYDLPARDDPEYDRAAAHALLEAARVNETQLPERATGYYWGEPRLRPFVEEMLAAAEQAGDDRLEQVARRYLR